jgi:hypothetical protein
MKANNEIRRILVKIQSLRLRLPEIAEVIGKETLIYDRLETSGIVGEETKWREVETRKKGRNRTVLHHLRRCGERKMQLECRSSAGLGHCVLDVELF